MPFFKKKSYLVWLWGSLCCCAGFSLVGVSRGRCLVAARGLLIVVASLVAEHRLQGAGALVVVARGLQRTAVAVVLRFSHPAACGIFLEQGSNPCPLHWQEDSYPLTHQWCPNAIFICTTKMQLVSCPSMLQVRGKKKHVENARNFLQKSLFWNNSQFTEHFSE